MRIALVGYGKVGQAVYRALKSNPRQPRDMEIVVITDPRFGRGLNPPSEVCAFSEIRRTHLPWRLVNPDLVIDASGSIQNRRDAAEHLASGAPRVIVTSSLAEADTTLIVGVNEESFDPFKHLVIAASSCTAVCFAPVAKLIADKLGISHMRVVVMHGYDTERVETDVDRSRVSEAAFAQLLAGQTARYQTHFIRNVIDVLPSLTGALSAEGWYVPINRTLLFLVKVDLLRRSNNTSLNAIVSEAADRSEGRIGFPNMEAAPAFLFPGNSFPTVFMPWKTHVVGREANLYFGGDYIYGYANAVLHLASCLKGEKA